MHSNSIIRHNKSAAQTAIRYQIQRQVVAIPKSVSAHRLKVLRARTQLLPCAPFRLHPCALFFRAYPLLRRNGPCSPSSTLNSAHIKILHSYFFLMFFAHLTESCSAPQWSKYIHTVCSVLNHPHLLCAHVIHPLCSVLIPRCSILTRYPQPLARKT